MWPPEDSRLSEIRQTQRDKGYVFSLKSSRRKKRVDLDVEFKSPITRSGQGGGAGIILRTAGHEIAACCMCV